MQELADALATPDRRGTTEGEMMATAADGALVGNDLPALWVQYKERVDTYLHTLTAMLAAYRDEDTFALKAHAERLGRLGRLGRLTPRAQQAEHAIDDLLGTPHDEKVGGPAD